MHRGHLGIIVGAALAAGGCSVNMFDKNEGGALSKPITSIFERPDGSQFSSAKGGTDFGGPVGPDDLVGPDGRCVAQVAQVPQPVAPVEPPAAATAVDRPAGGMAGELVNKPPPLAPAAPVAAPAPAADAGAPPLLGGVALGMTECQTVARAGQPGTVDVSAGDKGERRVVLTYLSGAWPGIYRFSDGRLKVIDRAPVPPEQAKPPAKKKAAKKKPANAKTSQRTIETVQ
jgi:hypothetical protein